MKFKKALVFMAKYSDEMISKICNLIASDDYTVTEIAEQVGINRATFFEWKNDYPDFLKAIKEAEAERLETFRKAARNGLRILLEGKEFEETTTEYKEIKVGIDKEGLPIFKPRMVAKKTVKKFILPNPTSVIFALKNTDADNFKDILRQEHSGPNGKPIPTETKHTVTFKKMS